jgi:hypothetical protein
VRWAQPAALLVLVLALLVLALLHALPAARPDGCWQEGG